MFCVMVYNLIILFLGSVRKDMNNKVKIGLILIIIGITLFVYYICTGIVFSHDYDMVSEIENAKITCFEDYVARGNYEMIILLLSIISFVCGLILTLVHFMKDKRRRNKQSK